MVVFTCNHCGDSLQKPTVEKHYNFTKCRKTKNLTCVDCLKDFHGEEYAAHTKCISESARYSAKGDQAEGMKKGELKQENWTEMIAMIIREDKDIIAANKEVKEVISIQPNVPRKKKQFVNFLRSATGFRASIKDIEYVWDIIEKYKLKAQKEKSQETKNGTEENGKAVINVESIETKDKKSKKRKVKEETKNGETKSNGTTDVDDEETTVKKVKLDDSIIPFNFQEKILKILEKKKSISLEKLQKKLVNVYLKHHDLKEETPKIIKKFKKNLKKVEQIKVEGENVILIET